jgi:hypothetical protein
LDNFITIKTFTYPHEASIIKGRLESEGIRCFVKDELTVQAYPLYSNAIGGVKLQVRESDFESAVAIMKEAGYLNERDVQPFPFYNKLENLTSKIPFLRDVRTEFRVLIITGVVISVAFIVGYFYKQF